MKLSDKLFRRKYRRGFDEVIELISLKDVIKLQKNLICVTAAEVDTYSEDWSKDFSVSQTKKSIVAISEQLQDNIPWERLTKKQLEKLGFLEMKKDLWCIPIYLYSLIPEEIELTSMSGNKIIKKDNRDLEVRGGCIAYGFKFEKKGTE